MEGIININGIIGRNVQLVDVITQVRKQKDATSFVVNIDSEGGDVDAGFDIFNYLKSLGLPIKTVGRGVVASIATVIFMAGGRREVAQGTIFMIHYPMITKLEYATSEELDMYSKELKKLEVKVKNFYSKNTGLEESTISTMLKNETFMTEEQLYDLGFTTSKEPVKIAAVLTLNNKKMANNEKEVGGKILNLVTNFLKGEKTEFSAKILFDAEQNEVNFPDLEENEEATVGANATINGEPADGEVVMADGRTFVFRNGELMEIRTDEDGDKDLEARVTALEETVIALQEAINTYQADAEEAEQEIAVLKKEKKEAVGVINKIKGIQSKMVTEDVKEKKVEPKKAERPFAAAIANLKKS